MHMTLAGYLTSLEAASMLGESHTTGGSNICAFARAGRIPGAEKAGRDWLIPLAWVESRLAQKREREAQGLPKMGRPRKAGQASRAGVDTE